MQTTCGLQHGRIASGFTSEGAAARSVGKQNASAAPSPAASMPLQPACASVDEQQSGGLPADAAVPVSRIDKESSCRVGSERSSPLSPKLKGSSVPASKVKADSHNLDVQVSQLSTQAVEADGLPARTSKGASPHHAQGTCSPAAGDTAPASASPAIQPAHKASAEIEANFPGHKASIGNQGKDPGLKFAPSVADAGAPQGGYQASNQSDPTTKAQHLSAASKPLMTAANGKAPAAKGPCQTASADAAEGVQTNAETLPKLRHAAFSSTSAQTSKNAASAAQPANGAAKPQARSKPVSPTRDFVSATASNSASTSKQTTPVTGRGKVIAKAHASRSSNPKSSPLRSLGLSQETAQAHASRSSDSPSAMDAKESAEQTLAEVRCRLIPAFICSSIPSRGLVPPIQPGFIHPAGSGRPAQVQVQAACQWGHPSALQILQECAPDDETGPSEAGGAAYRG